MVIVDVWHVPIVLSLFLIALVLAVSVLASLRATRSAGSTDEEPATG